MPQVARLTDELYVGNFQACADPQWSVVVHLHNAEDPTRSGCQGPREQRRRRRRHRRDVFLLQPDDKTPLLPETLIGLGAAWGVRRKTGGPMLVHCGAGMRRSPLACAWRLVTACGRTTDQARDVLTRAMATQYVHPVPPAVGDEQWAWLTRCA